MNAWKTEYTCSKLKSSIFSFGNFQFLISNYSIPQSGMVKITNPMPFSEVFSLSLSFLSRWLWLIFPLATFHVGWYVWLMWRELKIAEEFYGNLIFLRISLPRDIESTPKSMEQVFHNLHGFLGFIRPVDRVVWRERQPWLSIEIVGMNGNVYFIVALEKKRRAMLESALYSEYPEIEIEEVEDYTLSIPLNIPNKEWSLHGYEWVLAQEEIWRLKVYEDWAAEAESFVGRKFDPIAQWAEVCSSLKPGEHLWMQIIISPFPGGDWLRRGLAVRRYFDERKPTPESVFGQVFGGIGDFFRLLVGVPLEVREEREVLRFPTELQRKAVNVLGSKFERPVFEMNFRSLYIAQRDIYDRSRHASMRAFVRPFTDYTNNWIRPNAKTETRITQFPYLLPEFRKDIKRRRILWYYRMRFLRQEETNFGDFGFGEENLLFRLNAQELASILHFPGREVPAPGLRRLPFRKAKPPVELPTV